MVEAEPDKNRLVESVILKLRNSKSSKTLRRPISKLVLLIADNENGISIDVQLVAKRALDVLIMLKKVDREGNWRDLLCLKMM